MNPKLKIATFSRLRLGEEEKYHAVIPKEYGETFGLEMVRVVREFLAANPE